jgi:hypothetical protein
MGAEVRDGAGRAGAVDPRRGERREQQGGEKFEGVFPFAEGRSPRPLASSSSEMDFRTTSLERMLSQLKMQT